MTKKRDSDLKTRNQTGFERRGNQTVSQSTVQNLGVSDEGADAGDDSNPVTADMLKSREQAIQTNSRK